MGKENSYLRKTPNEKLIFLPKTADRCENRKSDFDKKYFAIFALPAFHGNMLCSILAKSGKQKPKRKKILMIETSVKFRGEAETIFSETKRMDLDKKFTLGSSITEEQFEFFNEYGFIHFTNVLKPEVVAKMIDEVNRIQQDWIDNDYEKVNGIPIRFGKDENGNKIVQRFAFASLHSEYLHEIVKDDRIQNLKLFIGEEARLTENERDGMVVNHYINTDESNYTKLGWHTDGVRDVFSHLKIDPMLNVGISLDDSPLSKGGLRVIPGSHRQSMFQMLFRKKYFVDNTPDKDEAIIETKAGDVTVHCGRMWHRVALSDLKGAASRRRVIYVPIIAGKYKPKHENSRTPFHHKFRHFVK